MSPRSQEQFDRMRQKSRQAIMEAAMELFTQRGYHGTSVSMIARRAGVSTGLMYNYFKSKVELLTAIVQRGMEMMGESLEDIEQLDDPRKKIGAMVDVAFDMAKRDMHFWSLYFAIIMQPDLPPEARGIFTRFIDDMFSWLEAMLGQSGYADPQGEARILGAVLDGALLHSWFVGPRYPADRVRKLIKDKYCQ